MKQFIHRNANCISETPSFSKCSSRAPVHGTIPFVIFLTASAAFCVIQQQTIDLVEKVLELENGAVDAWLPARVKVLHALEQLCKAPVRVCLKVCQLRFWQTLDIRVLGDDDVVVGNVMRHSKHRHVL